MSTMHAYVHGAVLWSGSEDPKCEGVPPTLLRGTSLVTRAAVDASLKALQASGDDPHTIPSIYGSAFGEIQTAVALIRSMERNVPLSPIRFKNSVHNTGSAIFGIAHNNRAFSTAISAGDDMIAMTFVEALAYLHEHGGRVLVSCTEENLIEPLTKFGTYPPLAFACVLGVDRSANGVRIGNLRTESRRPADVAQVHRANPCAPSLALYDAIAQRRAGTVDLSIGRAPAWCVDLSIS